MSKVIRLTENELYKLIKKVIKENTPPKDYEGAKNFASSVLTKKGFKCTTQSPKYPNELLCDKVSNPRSQFNMKLDTQGAIMWSIGISGKGRSTPYLFDKSTFESDLLKTISKMGGSVTQNKVPWTTLILPELKRNGFKYNNIPFGSAGSEVLEGGIIIDLYSKVPQGLMVLSVMFYNGRKEYSISLRKMDMTTRKYENSGTVSEKGTWSWDGKKITLQKK